MLLKHFSLRLIPSKNVRKVKESKTKTKCLLLRIMVLSVHSSIKEKKKVTAQVQAKKWILNRAQPIQWQS